MRVVGERIRPVGWEERTSGREGYAGDLHLPGSLVGKIVWSTEAHARIEELDVSPAQELPGVHAVITAADLPPGTIYVHQGGEHSDRPPLADGVVRFVGEPVAAVAAETEEAAVAAVRAVRARYRRLPAPLTIEEALKDGAPTLHRREAGPNLSVVSTGQWGDPETARGRSEEWIEGTYRYPRVTHLCMEPNTTVASWDPESERLELWTSTQAPYFIVKEVSRALGLEPEQVICREVAVGGGFGSKSKISEHEVIAAALSMKSGRPVRVAYSREEEFLATKPRHAFRVHLETGFERSGRFRLLQADVDVDNGAYNHYGPSVMQVGIKLLGSMYRPSALTWRARLVDTALPPGGQFRGYGSPQAAFALESQVDEIARRLGADPLELRILNANRPDATALSGSKIGTARLVECLEAVREAIGWEGKRRHPAPGRGVGVAVGIHGSGAYAYDGANRSECGVDIHEDGRVRVRYGGADPGTGQRTVLAQIVSEELGVPIEAVEVLSMDSEQTPFDMGAWSSRGTHMMGHAARQAASEAAGRLRELAAEKLGEGRVRLEGGMARSGEDAVPVGDLVGLASEAVDGVLSVESEYLEGRMERFVPERGPVSTSASYTFAAHAVEVEVDRETGAVRILDYVAAHDIGTAINPTLAESQIIGGVVMGLGAALGEEMIYEQGRLVNPAYIDYPTLRAADVPPVRPILVEGGEPAGPYGAKSVGELPVTPVAAAVANAIDHAVGVRLREPPFTPDKVLAALGEEPPRPSLWRRPGRWWIALMRWMYPRGLFTLLHRWGTRLAREARSGPVEELVAPDTVDEAMQDRRAGDAYVAGGTDLLLQRRQGLVSPVRLVSISEMRELHGVGSTDDGGFRIGAGVTLRDLAEATREELPMVAEAVETIASPQIREMATVAGNLVQAKRCWFYRNGFDCYKRSGPTSPCYAILGDHRFYHAALGAHRCQAVTPSDLATVLAALDAELSLQGPRGARRMTIHDLYVGPGETALTDGEMVVEVRLPRAALARRGAFEKLSLWQGDFAVVSAAVAARLDGDGWHDARVVLGAVAPEPWRARRTEQALERWGTERVREAVDTELARHGHPLPGNAWKLSAVSALVERAAQRMAGDGSGAS